MKKVILALCMLLVLGSCTQIEPPTTEPVTTEEVPTENNGVIYLPYFSGESLDVFTVKSKTNTCLLSAVYDYLFYADSAYEPESDIVSSYLIEDNTITVYLNKNIRFSDSSPVTPKDIVYSFEAAAKGKYKDTLALVKSAKAKNDFVVFTFNEKVSKRHLLCLKFPIAKSKTNLGTGEYILSGNTLKQNTHFRDYKKSDQEIQLYALHDAKSLYYNLNAGAISAAVISCDTDYTIQSTNEIHDFISNNLIYAGVNTNKDFLSNPNIRRALNVGINREYITENTLSYYSLPVWQPFNPDWWQIKDTAYTQSIYSLSEAKSMLIEEGCDYKGAELFYKNKPVTLTILANSDNSYKATCAKAFASSLKSLGINAQVNLINFNEYKTAVSKSEYDLYIGEMRISDVMDITPLWEKEICTLSEGKWAVLEAYRKYDENEDEFYNIIDEFENQMPFFPLYYNKNALVISKNISGEIMPSEDYIYKNLSTWVYKYKK